MLLSCEQQKQCARFGEIARYRTTLSTKSHFVGDQFLRDFPFEGALIGTPCSWLWYSVLKLVSLKIVWNYAQFSVVRMEVPSAVLELQV